VGRIGDVDRKLLWGRSGDECAFSDCPQVLTQTVARGKRKALVLGEEAHIVAEKDDGPRGDPSMPPGERNSYENLILLCPTHHTFIDKDGGIHFSVLELQAMKQAHEGKIAQRRQAAGSKRDDSARQRHEALLERASACRGRLIARWVSVGVSASLAEELTDDPNVGGCRPEVRSRLKEKRFVVLEGDFGSGKSVSAERWHAEALETALHDEHAAVPVYLEAQAVKNSLIEAVRAEAKDLGDPRSVGVRLVLDGLDESGTTSASPYMATMRDSRDRSTGLEIGR